MGSTFTTEWPRVAAHGGRSKKNGNMGIWDARKIDRAVLLASCKKSKKIYHYSDTVKILAAIQSAKKRRIQGEADVGLDQQEQEMLSVTSNSKNR